MVAIAQARNPETNVFDRVGLVVTRYVCVCVCVYCVCCAIGYSSSLCIRVLNFEILPIDWY